jgi:hypothetical protein
LFFVYKILFVAFTGAFAFVVHADLRLDAAKNLVGDAAALTVLLLIPGQRRLAWSAGSTDAAVMIEIVAGLFLAHVHDGLLDEVGHVCLRVDDGVNRKLLTTQLKLRTSL